MSLPTLRCRAFGIAITMALALAAGACSDRSLTTSVPPGPPPVSSNRSAMIRGTVREDGTLVLESLDPSIQAGDSNVSGAIYGNQNVTAKVTVSQFNLSTAGGTKTWTFKLAIHNLLNYPIGSIDGAATPWDTTGVYVFFSTPPSVVSPANCGCTVTTLKTQGQASFTSPDQPYYWYYNRLAAVGQPGDSTTNNPVFTFTAPQTVQSFRFLILLSTPWPRGLQTRDTSWSVLYNPASDSFPDANAKPRWKGIGVNFGGSYGLSGGTLLQAVNHSTFLGFNTSTDQLFYRSDNLNRSENAYVEERLALTNSGGSNPVAILGLADSVKFVGMGIGNGKIGFVTFNANTLAWEWLSGATQALSTTSSPHVYRGGKFGAGTATVYVDGVEKFSQATLPDNFMPQYSTTVGAQAAKLSVIWGITGQDANANATVNYVTYAFHATPKPN